ncbi:MAG TPA: 30S ribosomal protein S17 [Lentisphaeria bacterium]|nr:30S ribosomal protein S17 [Lentisphaeria bacterium]
MPEEDTQQQRNLRKVLTATVVSDKQNKTLVVKVYRRAAHQLYRKVVTFTSKCYVHDENNEAKVGDVVQIMETRPLSKTKRWRLVTILKRAVTE